MLTVAAKKTVPEPEPDLPRRQVNARLPEDLARALKRFIDSQRVPPDYTAVTIVALKEFLERAGFWPAPDQP